MLHAGILGLEMGLVYDLLCIIRQVWHCRFVMTAFIDLGFWGFVAYRTFEVMHTYSNGTLRWFAILGAMVVLGLYRSLFSRYLMAAGVFLLSQVRNVFTKVKKVLTNILKMSIIKLGKSSGKGEKHGKKSHISDKVS